jgi:L-lactate dehydrogenase complex protein LldE
MCRTLGLKDEPRHLLQQAGYAISEMSESERCCGFGGLFSMRMPEVSNAMSSEKLRQASETKSHILVTSDPGCLMQLRGLAHQQPDLRLEHLAVMLEEATR